MKHYYRFFTLLFAGTFVNDLVAQAQQGSSSFGSLFSFENLLWAVIIILFIAILILYRVLMSMIKMQELKIYEEHGLTEYLKSKEVPGWQKFKKSWTKITPIERESEIMSAYEYDGIRELDNKLPPWWLGLFYITIVIGVVYLFNYEFSGRDWSSGKQWQEEMEVAQARIDDYLSTQADLVNENTVTLLTDETELAGGKEIFESLCAVCHAVDGGGGVGPNMTDDYWVHGGSIKDLFRTINVGVPEKGMISWKSQLKASQMQQVASYILTSIQGTTPADPKAPEGDLYVKPDESEEEQM